VNHFLSYHFSKCTGTAYGEAGWRDMHQKKVGLKHTCEYCNNVVENVFSQNSIPEVKWYVPDVIEVRDFLVYLCSSCGWWQIYRHDRDDRLSTGGGDISLYSAVLREFDVSGIDTPLLELEKYLLKNRDKIYHIHHKKMEELVGSVLKDFFDCEVKYCGGSHDKGIDLLVLESDRPFPVQVKRRTSPKKTESVTVVREMLGVMFRDQFKKGTVVSTADHFSSVAIKEAEEVVEKGLLERFDLINVNDFIGMLGLTKQKTELPDWYDRIPQEIKIQISSQQIQEFLTNGYLE